MPVSNRSMMSSLPSRVLGSLAGIAILITVFYLTAPEPPPPTEKKEVVTLTEGLDDRRCDRDLQRILEAMRPGRLGISSDPLQMVDELNRWMEKCGRPEEVAELIADRDFGAALLPEEAAPRLRASQFLPSDANHIRESFLAQGMVEAVIQSEKSELKRVMKLFEMVTMYTALMTEQAATEISLTPYESLLFGVGTAADRAWALAVLNRQLSIDTVIIAPSSQQKQQRWLIGVLIPREGVFLFDAHLGLPIPSPADTGQTPFPERPATLAELRENDAPLRALDTENEPYPWSQSDFQKVTVHVIGSPATWAPRMAELQYLLPSSIVVDLYDGLGPNALHPQGLWERVGGFDESLWTMEDLQIWTYPLEQIARSEATRGAEGTFVADFLKVFAGPYMTHVDNTSGQEYQGTADRSLHLVRTEQLMGQFGDALKHLFPIRSVAQRSLNPANQLAADYAALWAGMCQFEQGKYQPAFNTFQRYLGAHPQGDGSSVVAAEWLIRCLLATGQFEEAAQRQERIPSVGGPFRNAYLSKRWRALAPAAESENE